MESLTSHLGTFCWLMLHKYGSPDKLSTEHLAQKFRRIYIDSSPLKLPLDMGTLCAVARACGATVLPHRMPGRLRGYHELVDDRMTIYYREDDSLSGKENTILHELRELMEPFFVKLHAGYEPLKTTALHWAANRFAAAVLMPQETFCRQVYETGFDVLALGQLYSKSHSQILLRMGEVLQGDRFFYGALYEPGLIAVEAFRVSYWASSANAREPEANFYGPRGFLPRKGQSATFGSLVNLAIDSRRPHHVERIILSQDTGDYDITALAQPVVNGEEVSRVALVELRGRY